MSGIVGIAYSDCRPVSRQLLEQMALSLSFRGPDSQRIWFEGNVGLGHAAQLIDGDETRGGGPETLGDGNWISADVRLDAREELVAALRSLGKGAHLSFSDSQLLLAAYGAWGEQCLEHVFGDFAFILWDTSRKQLFCACDHFGIRQLYFVHRGPLFVCSNTLNCLRLHSEVSTRLNDIAIADFLLFGKNQNVTTTTFADIRHLPGGHFLQWSRSFMKTVEYWRPPLEGKIRYKRQSEYVEHFSELLQKAVADRTRGRKVGILLSGGLDSSSVAALCGEERDRRGSLDLHAFTVTAQDSLDDDGQAAETVARNLKIPLHLTFADRMFAFEAWDSLDWPEPVDDPLAGGMVEQFSQVSALAPVILSGEGSDNLMEFEPWPHLRMSWHQGHRMRAVGDIASHVAARFREPDGLRGPLRRMACWFGAGNGESNELPEWLNPEFVRQLHLKKRWQRREEHIPWNVHRWHPAAYASLFFSEWPYMFQREDPAFTNSAVEVRYPFLDVRIINYLLGIPAMPWFFRKFLLRETMRGRIPENVRRRAKRGATEDPLTEATQKIASILREKKFADEIQRYVNLEALASFTWKRVSSGCAPEGMRPWCLDFWLKQVSRADRLGRPQRARGAVRAGLKCFLVQ